MVKTKQGLEKELKLWKVLGFIFFVFLFFSAMSFLYLDEVMIPKLKLKFAECQDQVPVWTLKFVCLEEDIRVTFENNFTSYEEYEVGLQLVGDKDYKLFENCEVIE